MSQPPITPVTSGKHKLSYFEHLTMKIIKENKKESNKRANEDLNLEKIELEFDGYRELLKEYRELTVASKKKSWQLARDFNMWSEYFSGLANEIQKIYADIEAEKLKIKSQASHDADPKKVANGKRLANQDERVIEIRKLRNLYKAYYDELKAKIEFLNRAHYHCKSSYELNLEDINENF